MNAIFNGKKKYLFLLPVVLLIILAILSHQALQILNASWLTAILITALSVSFLLNMVSIALLCYLGSIYKSRSGAKWRKVK